jgi:hypothetical protein
MSIIRLRLPQTGFEKNVNAARTFVLRSEFRGEMNLVCSDEQYMQAVEKGELYLFLIRVIQQRGYLIPSMKNSLMQPCSLLQTKTTRIG